MLRAVLDTFWKQHPANQQLYNNLPPISQMIRVRPTKYVGHCWRSKDELISDVIRWTTTNGHTSFSRIVRTYIHQFCAETGGSQEGAVGNDGRYGKRKARGSLLSARLDDDDDDGDGDDCLFGQL